MSTPQKTKLSDYCIGRILQTIEDQRNGAESRSFLQICNDDKRTFGSKGSSKRRDCQVRRNKFIQIARTNPSNYQDFLNKYCEGIMASTAEIKDDIPSENNNDTKQKTRSASTKKNESAHSQAKKREEPDPVNLGKWFHFLNGQEIYADKVVAVGTGDEEAFLNAHLDYLQHLPAVRFEDEKRIHDVECYAMHQAVEVTDIELGLVSLRRTTMPNAVAMCLPLIPASLRADFVEEDKETEQVKKLKTVAKNFMVRNMKTGKLDKFWCQPAWDAHQKTLANVQKSQAEEGKKKEVAMNVILFVFPKDVEFSSDAFASEDDQGVIVSNFEPFLAKGQAITRLRWLLPTTKSELIRDKLRGKASVNDVADRLKQAVLSAGNSNSDDEEVEGTI